MSSVEMINFLVKPGEKDKKNHEGNNKRSRETYQKQSGGIGHCQKVQAY